MAKTTYTAKIFIDEDSMREGYDGVTPLDPKREWTAYSIELIRRCGHCGVDDEMNSDVLGAVWVSDDAAGKRHLWNTIRDMIGRRIRRADVNVEFV